MKLKVGSKYPEYDNYWSMGNISGSDLIDENGTHNGTIYGAVQTEGIKGKALSFDGTDDYVQIPVGLSYVNRSSYSISCWFKLDTLKNMNCILSIGDSPTATSPNFILRADNEVLKTYNIGRSQTYITVGTVEAGKWYHEIITRTTTVEKVYLNNVLTSEYAVGNTSGTATNIYFGAGYNGKLDGLLDEVLYYNKVLTEEEIAKIYKIGLNKINLKVKGNSLNEGLVGYWTMDNVSGSDLIAEKGNNGTIYGATQVNGKLNKALSFDGTDDYVNTTSTFIDEEPFTFCSWFYPNTVNTDAGIVIQSNSAGNRNGVVLTGERLIALLRKESSSGYAYYTTPNAYVVGQWNFVAGIWDGTNAKIFVNGTEYIGGSRASVSNASANITFIGRNQFANGTGTRYFNGLIDDTMIYNRALTLDEIKKIYNNGLGKYKPLNNNLVNVPKIDKTGLVARYTMDNISGTTLIDETGVNNGTIYGATQVDGKIGKALNFDGVDDYVDCGNNVAGNSNMTISFWINPSANQQGGLIYKTADYTAVREDYHIYWWTGTQGIQIGFSDGATITYNNFGGSGIIIINEWQLITVVKTGTKVDVYRNSIFSGSANNYPVNVQNTATPLIIGKESVLTQRKFKGKLDEVMFFNRALSQEEISYLYNSGKGKYSPFR